MSEDVTCPNLDRPVVTELGEEKSRATEHGMSGDVRGWKHGGERRDIPQGGRGRDGDGTAQLRGGAKNRI